MQCLSYDGQKCVAVDSTSAIPSYVISDNTSLRALDNSSANLKSYLDQHDSVRLATSDGNWTGNIRLPNQSTEGKRLTLDVQSSWGV